MTTTRTTTLGQLPQNLLEQYYTNLSTNAQFELNHAQHEAMRQQQEAFEQQLPQNVGTDVQRAVQRSLGRRSTSSGVWTVRDMTESIHSLDDEENSHA